MEIQEEKKTTIEDILGIFGFRVVWNVTSYWADVAVRDDGEETVVKELSKYRELAAAPSSTDAEAAQNH